MIERTKVPGATEESGGRPSVLIRPATPDDSHFVYSLNVHPSVRANAISGHRFEWSDHQAWYSARLAESDSVLCVVCEAQELVGVVRVDTMGPERIAGVITVAITDVHRGRGLGRLAIGLAGDMARTQLGMERIVAFVRPENLASVRAFERSGYAFVETVVERGVKLSRYELELEGLG